MKKLARLLFALIALAVLLIPVSAQTGTGTVRGTVYDPTQAGIPGATVILTNQKTNDQRRTTTTSEGIYSFAAVPPGAYTASVEASGFKKWEGTLELQVGQTAVANATMQVGSVDTVVEVTGAAPVITTESAEVADVKDALRIQQLPLNGRDVSSLFTLTPGVEGGGSPRVNGLKVGATEMLLDGISVVDRFGGGIARVQPGLDTVQEFRIETVGSSAQYSRPATITLVTKSGTNEFHGTLFETHRNNAGGLRARQRQDGNTAAKLIRNEYGVSAGGPVYIPQLFDGRDRTFWFAAWEGLKQRESVFARGSVPTETMWRGDFSGLVDSAGQRTTIYDPMTTNAEGRRQPFAGNLIPVNRQNPFFAKMRDVTPMPTNDVNPYIGENFQAVYPNTTDVYKFTAKGDHRFSDRDMLTGRFSVSNLSQKLRGGRFSIPPPTMENAYGSGRTDAKIYTPNIRYTRIISPTLLNELNLGIHRSAKSSGTLADNTPWANNLGLPNPFGAQGWPTLYTDWFAWDADNRKDEMLTGYVMENNVSWNRGKHSLRWGAKVRWEQNNIRELQQAQGSHGFEGAWTSLYDPDEDQAVSFTGNGLADLALGIPSDLTNQNNRGYFYFRQTEIGLYVQDTWKVTPRLTLDLGVRWDRWSPYSEKQNRFVGVDPATVSDVFQVITPGNVRMEELPGALPAQLASYALRGLTWTTADEIGYPSNLVRADNNNFGPRLGAAYTLGNRTSLRAGYGEYFWTMPLSQILQSMRTTPPLNLRFSNPISTLDGTGSFGVRTAPRPEFFVGNAMVSTEGIVQLPVSALPGMSLDGRNWKDARVQSWHVTLEHEVMKDTAVRFTYLGEHARDLEQRYALNPREAEYNYVSRTGVNPPGNRDLLRANPNWSLFATNRSGYSNTHSAQAEIERRYSNGLLFQGFYTFSRSLTTTDAGGFTSGNGAINSVGGNAVFEVPDVTQVFGAPNLSFDDRLRLGYYNSGNVPAHRIRWNAFYELPFGRSKRWGSGVSGLVNAIIGGWQLASIGEWQSGNWLGVDGTRYLFGDPTLSADERLLLTFGRRRQRLWFRGDFDPLQASNADQTKLQALVPADRSQRVLRPLGAGFDNRIPVTMTDGSIRMTTISDTVNWNARNFYRGPGQWDLTASVYKNFNITERTQLRFTADFFNVLNHPVDVDPNVTTGLQDLSIQRNQPRVIQFSLRFSW
ncbi:MAG: TonB-dependent receptor [Bryobacteraceae bacterium]|nr:TonB-dependent receptor [Bryobacterales bacterium]NUN02212.1 TonB-dependent receptor [Bryobacteraceae bacterium]